MTSPSPSHNLFDFGSVRSPGWLKKQWVREALLWVNVLGLPVICILLIGILLGTVDWQLQVALLASAIAFVVGWLMIIVYFIEPKLFPADEWVTSGLKHSRRT